MVQAYSEETATDPKPTAIVAYPIHIANLNFSKRYHCALIDHENELAALLPASTSEVCHEHDL